jgi:D-lyxose ketol-isomerase
MITAEQRIAAQRRALDYLTRAGIALTAEERENVEVADFGLGELERTGLELVIYVNTERCCAKELVLFPRQTCPQHRHPPVEGEPGKEETFRCRWGEVYLYIPGPAAAQPKGIAPAGSEPHYTIWNEIVLKPGDQFTMLPNTPHWFQGGDDGAVVSEFSTRSRDESDIFQDPRIVRETLIG